MKRIVSAAVAGVALAGAIGIGVAAAATGEGPASRIADALTGLVSKGTITQEQADAVGKALEDAHARGQAERDQQRQERQAEVDALLKNTLGMTADEVRAQIRAGKTLKEIAGDKADELAAGMVGLAKEHAADAVAEGRITQEQADELIARAEERAKAWVSGDESGMGRGMGLGLLMGGMGRGMGPDGFGHHRGGPGMGQGSEDSTEGDDSGPSGSSASATTSWQV